MAGKFLIVVFLVYSVAEVMSQKPVPGRVEAVGMPIEIAPDHQEVQLYTKKAFPHLSVEYPGDNHPKIQKVTKATRQLVAGLLYKIYVDVGTSNCSKDKAYEETCSLLEDTPTKKCLISAWVKSWENFEKIEVTCQKDN